MRKAISIFLLLMLCASWYGYRLFFQVQVSRAKTEMKTFLLNQKDHEGLVVFRFTTEETQMLEWEDEHEFRYKGQMYDVVGQQKQDGNLMIRCIQDEKETALLNAFLKTTKKNSGTYVLQLLIAPFVLPRIELPQPAAVPPPLYFSRHSYYLKSADLSIVIPPPRQV